MTADIPSDRLSGLPRVSYDAATDSSQVHYENGVVATITADGEVSVDGVPAAEVRGRPYAPSNAYSIDAVGEFIEANYPDHYAAYAHGPIGDMAVSLIKDLQHQLDDPDWPSIKERMAEAVYAGNDEGLFERAKSAQDPAKPNVTINDYNAGRKSADDPVRFGR